MASVQDTPAGYRGFYSNKESSTREGCALFYTTAKYSCVCQRTIALKKIMAEIVNEGEAASRHTQLLPILRSSASLQHNLQQVHLSVCNGFMKEWTPRMKL